MRSRRRSAGHQAGLEAGRPLRAVNLDVARLDGMLEGPTHGAARPLFDLEGEGPQVPGIVRVVTAAGYGKDFAPALVAFTDALTARDTDTLDRLLALS